MIKIEQGPSFCQVGEETMATQPIDRFVVYYGTPGIGKVQAYLIAEKMTSAATEESPATYQAVDMGGNPTLMNFSEEEFSGKVILSELHSIYLLYLKELNPKITFKSTL